MKRRPRTSGGVLAGIGWSRWSVVLCKPGRARRGLVDEVLERIDAVAPVPGRQDVVVADWQVFVHYWDLLVDRDRYDANTPAVLREMYAGKRVTVALAHGPAGTDTPASVRSLLGYFGPSQAAPDSVRGALWDGFCTLRAMAARRQASRQRVAGWSTARRRSAAVGGILTPSLPSARGRASR
ncbi:hypothetical protein ACG5V6_04845 [Streptomyces chitinivorans]|uniref:Uncharacterized protein n=1 Tax=Streptomyces chitinivorans TaxID=1257027 RepID=A0ABW7HNX9_9ACTN|nr:hypothetical protein [Streptomyces chitinivorans]MDH2411784.1 hypothetical protein [Streptomyces chitinivorans]